MPTTAPGGQVADSSHLIPHQYIVIYKSRWKGLVKGSQARQAMQFVNARINELELSKKAVKHRYQSAFRGFDARLTNKQLKKLKKDPRVKDIEQDQRFQYVRVGRTSNRTTSTAPTPKTSQQIIPWGVSRVNGPFYGTGNTDFMVPVILIRKPGLLVRE